MIEAKKAGRMAHEVIGEYLDRTGATSPEEVAGVLGILVGNTEVTLHRLCGATSANEAMLGAKLAAAMAINPSGLSAALFREHIRNPGAVPDDDDPKAPE